MKIVMVTPTIGNAFGQEKAVAQSCRLLRAQGHQVHVLTDKQVGPFDACDSLKLVPGFASLQSFTPRSQARRCVQEVIGFIKSTEPEVVHWHDLVDARIVSSISKEYPTVFTPHTVSASCPQSARLVADARGCTRLSGWKCLSGHYALGCLSGFKSDLHRLHAIQGYLSRTRAMKSNVGAVVAVSRYLQNLLEKENWGTSRIFWVPNAVSTEPVPPLDGAPWPLLVFAARLSRLKGLDLLLQALIPFSEQPWTLWVCGEGEDRALLEAYARAHFKDKVRFLGRTEPDHTLRIFASATALIAPNRGPEAFGLTVAEASALAIVVIASQVPGLEELVENENSGFLFPAGDVGALSERISRVLQGGEGLGLLGEQARKKISNRCAPQAHLAGLLGAYALAQQAFLRPTQGSVLRARCVHAD